MRERTRDGGIARALVAGRGRSDPAFGAALVLRGMSLHLPHRGSTVLVDDSGPGKSTVVAILM
ncbi:hypothetical protein [Saccharopolyspora sp. CA-218241]|uniref:hypothetical protein n=1 Tax=Saccharopolyspora sp. CA-218241 TaxID=3240027 RepID=UPI003D976151